MAAPALDEDLHSRQMAVYGRESMIKLSGASVLIAGLNGLGAETAKNVILAGVKSVTLQDTKKATPADLGANFYLTPSDIGMNRAEACKDRFQELNPEVRVNVVTGAVTPKMTQDYRVVVMCDASVEEAAPIDAAARAQSPPVAFIYASLHGVFGSLFCDFGPDFVCADTTGEAVKTAIVSKIEKSEEGKPAQVQCVLDEEIDLDDGDHVQFTEVKGMTELNDGKPRVISDVSKMRKCFKIQDTSGMSAYESGGIVTQVKMLKVLKFRAMSDTLTAPGHFQDADTSKQSDKAKNFDEAALAYFGQPEFEAKFGRSGLLHLGMRALNAVGVAAAVAEGGADAVVAKARELNEAAAVEAKVEEFDERVETLKNLARGAGAVISPMAAVFGGVAGQEVIKACTTKFHPTFQWFHFDCEESLPAAPPASLSAEAAASRYAGQIQVYGADLQDKLEKLNVFLVGSGALGCEFLKDLALMGCASKGGQLTVTDDDTIEKSNLSRQFLFRNTNIGMSKSLCAGQAAAAMNPEFNVKAMQERVQPTTENVFDDAFWDGLDVVVNALDNVKARLYVDSKCVMHCKPLLESGTLGPKSNVQCVIPHLTENYGASRDPPEKEAPQCALHNFPHNIDHCLGLARSEFVGNFETVPADAASFAENPDKFVTDLLAAGENTASVMDKLRGDPKFNCAMTGGLHDVIVAEHPSNFEQCVGWARRKYQSYFVDRIALLVHNCPEDMKTDSGTSFWAPPKRFPKNVAFDADDAMAMKFVIAASNLRAKLFGISEEHRDVAYFKSVLNDVKIPEFTPFNTEVETDEKKDNNDAEAAAPANAKSPEEEEAELKAAVKEIAGALAEGAAKTFVANEFEKDCDTNFHIDFIQSFANLRARNYAIEEVDFLQAKLKAGRIIPAIATATAMATGFVCLELLKVLGNKELKDYRNTFSNLALPLFSQAEPAPCEKIVSGTRFDPAMYMDVDEVAVPDPQTVWDTLTIKAKRDMTIGGLVEWFKNEKNLVLEGWMFVSTDKQADSSPIEDRLDTKIVDYLEKMGYPMAGKKKFMIGDSPPDARVLELKTDEDADVKICRVVVEFED
eukprot:TRINITY_DN7442_c0_g1_i1.p1 TRINITY_DN7442_c0_g1~~TRINITY_DN7442_c0_g1_i1.p1  ORF type:complete len:1096 (+),score=453.90 TRINITY_DN7442_c0_g1_i1:48-3290(+)